MLLSTFWNIMPINISIGKKMCKCLTYQLGQVLWANKFRSFFQEWLILPLDVEIELKDGLVTTERPIRVIPYILPQGESISENKPIWRKIMVRDGNRDTAPK